MANLIEKVKAISEKLDNGKMLINEDNIEKFKSSALKLQEHIDDVLKEGRCLRIGIVGEVKAGKSSFLNALIFNGEDILPKAPTPMTAALTKISYSEKPKAKIVFYSTTDWDAIKQNAMNYTQNLKDGYKEYCQKKEEEQQNAQKNKKEIIPPPQQIMSFEQFEKRYARDLPEEFRSCKEVYDMAEKNKSKFTEDEKNLNYFLGREIPISADSENSYDFLNKLNDYVGADGKYTPIVKYTEIQINNKMLEGIEIIDTPGLNDPIRSRSRTTHEFLKSCDAVFLMSYCGQFLGADDIGFIMSSLPKEGIKKAVLIGSKLDSAIQQYPNNGNPEFMEAYLGTISNCNKQAEDNINDCLRTASDRDLLLGIKSSLPPLCVSSLAFSAALKLKAGEPFSDIENLMKNGLSRYPGFICDYETLMGLSNIPDVKESVFNETRAEKDKLIAERVSSIYDVERSRFLDLLEKILIKAKDFQHDVKNNDRDALYEKLDMMKESLDKVRIAVKNRFEKAANDSALGIQKIQDHIRKEAENHLTLQVTQETETKHHRSTDGFWIFKTTSHWEEHITHNLAAVSDAENEIRFCITRFISIINENFRTLLGIDKLKEDIKSMVMDAFDMSNRNFNESQIILPLENAARKITLHDFEIKEAPYLEMLDGILSGKVTDGSVKDNNIPVLKSGLSKVIYSLVDDVNEEIKKCGEAVSDKFNKYAVVFIDEISKELEENHKQIEKLLSDKEKNLELLEEFISDISDSKKLLMQRENGES